MKIEQVTARALSAGAHRSWIIVAVVTDDGHAGTGEATLGGKEQAVIGCVEDLAPHIRHEDPLCIEHLWQLMLRHSFMRPGAVIAAAMSGIELALWDIAGQYYNVPVYQLLGGKVRDRIRVYFSGVTAALPEECAERARRASELGFRALKMSPFEPHHLVESKHTLAREVERVAAVRQEVGPGFDIAYDLHGRFPPSMTVRLAQELDDLDILFLEEPCLPENIDVLSRIAGSVSTPLATGERFFTRFQFRSLLETQAIAVVQPDVCLAGGIFECRKIAAMAEAYSVAVAPHNPYGPVATMASLHLDACVPNFLIQELVVDDIPWRPRLDIIDGYVELPPGPGLGIALSDDLFTEHPGQPVSRPVLRHPDGSVADW